MDSHPWNNQHPATLIDVLRWRALLQPDRRAYTFLANGETEQDTLTYGELDYRARAIATKLQQRERRNECALLLYPPGLDYIVAFFGCLYAGVVAIPAALPRVNRPSPHLQAILQDSRATILLTNSKILPSIQSSLVHLPELEKLHWLVSDTFDTTVAEQWRRPDITRDTVAYLQYTSGSTSSPKGVMISHRNVLHNSMGFANACASTPQSILVAWMPHFHDFGLVYCIVHPLYVGFLSILMPPASFIQQPLRWLNALSYYQATHTGAPNFAYDLCVEKTTTAERTALNLSTLQVAINGAEPVRSSTLENFSTAFESCGFRSTAFMPGYGLAECTLRFSTAPREEHPLLLSLQAKELEQGHIATVPDDQLSEEKEVRRLVGCGSATDGMTIAVVDPSTLTRCGEDKVGEIWLQGESVSQGYWKRPEETQQTFQAYLSDTGEGPFLRTGDLGFIKQDQIFITGRLKDLIIVRGRNHYPQDIEQTVEQSHSALRAGCGAAFSVEAHGEEQMVVVQEIERRGRHNLDVDEVIQHIRRALVEQHEVTPYAIVLVRTGTIARTTSGKVQRRTNRAAFLNKTLTAISEWYDTTLPAKDIPLVRTRPTVPTRKAIREWLVTRLAQRSGVSPEKLDTSRPFTDYGLDSLSGVALMGELERWLDRSLSPTLLWNYPSIDQLVRYLIEDQQETDEKLALTPVTFKKVPPSQEEDAIAIVGIGCRFPGADSPQAFWHMVCDGVDATSEVPPERWDADALYDATPATPGKLNTRRGGFLRDVDKFDPHFFSITPREAIYMDPQQRLLLEVSWEALEHAGQAPDRLAGTPTGVFVGVSTNDYMQLILRSKANLEAYMATGISSSITANRLSYLLDLRGPSLSVDTACSSSLVAVHMACQSLRNNECTLALAGGVNLQLTPELTISFSHAHLMAADGRCKAFDARADGYARGDGCGMVVLKRLSDAQRDGNTILALVRGSAINQDGRSNGLTAPNGWSQQAVIDTALNRAGVAPHEISCIEAHGTGTPLGDPIEIESLKAVLSTGRKRDQTCAIGSVKTNIGHLEAAAGIAGLIKMVLALHHGKLPPHLHLQKLNPHISLDDTPFFIPTELTPWPEEVSRRLAGVSSFGFGGTNSHIVLEEGPTHMQEAEPFKRPLHLLTLSARTPAALHTLAQRYADVLVDQTDDVLVDICYTANSGRTHFTHRLAVTGATIGDMQKRLTAFVNQPEQGTTNGIIASSLPDQQRPAVVFLFSGQGAQTIGMGRQLYETHPTFRAILDKCDKILRPYLEHSLLAVMYPRSMVEESYVHMTAYTQPALFAIEYALAKLWESWGIMPVAMLGHSIGEYVAACLAGVFSLEDALKLVATRGRLMQALPQKGAMAAVFTSEATVAEVLAPYTDVLAISGINSPDETVISGDSEALQTVLEQLDARGITYHKLNVSHAFHSPLMDPMLAEFEREAAKVRYRSPRIPVVSNVTGQIATEKGMLTTPQYWRQHVRQTVRFAPGLTTLYENDYTVFVEIGPRPTLIGLGKKCLPAGATWLPSLHPRREDWQQMLESLARLYTAGVTIDWEGFERGYRARQRVALPTYPFQRQSYWIQTGETAPLAVGTRMPQLQPSSSEPGETSLTPAPTASNVASQEISRNMLLAAEPEERSLIVETYLRQHLARVTGLTTDELDPHQSLNTLGLDSLMAVELKNRIETNLQVVLSIGDLYRGMDMAGVASLILEEIFGKQPAGELEAEHLLENLDDIPDDQVDALLRAMMEEEQNDD
jgi:acyl transferase domain-containing protein/acyl-CoA synthetase (AMP-forming)/AMP-acid ligase II